MGNYRGPSGGGAPNVSLATGTLPVANGGTNSTTALNNGRFLTSQSGAIKEQSTIIIVQPSEGMAGIVTAMNTLDAGNGGTGGKVQLVAGTYVATAAAAPNVGIKGVIVEGVGDETILQANGSFSGALLTLTAGAGSTAINDVTVGDTSITTTTAAQGANFGDCNYLIITGTDVNSEADMQEVMAVEDVFGSASTGVVPLASQVQKTMTSCTVYKSDYGNWMHFRNFKMEAAAGSATIALSIANNSDCIFENISIDGTNFASGTSGVINIAGASYNVKNLFRNIKIDYAPSIALYIQNTIYNVFENIKIRYADSANTATRPMVKLAGNNTDLTFNGGNYISARDTVFTVSGTIVRRLKWNGCTLLDSQNGGIVFGVVGLDCKIQHCTFDTIAQVTTGGGSYAIDFLGGCKRMTVTNNNFLRPRFAIVDRSGGTDNIFSHNSIYKTHHSGVGMTLSGTRTVCTGNNIDGCSDDGIYLGGSNCVITNNIINGCTNYGIETGNVSDCVISGNMTSSNTVKGILLPNGASNNIVSFNLCKEGITTGSGANFFTGNVES